MARWSEAEIREFDLRFAELDLGYLECVRCYVEMHAMDNGGDAEDKVSCAIATAKGYVDDEKFGREVFSAYPSFKVQGEQA